MSKKNGQSSTRQLKRNNSFKAQTEAEIARRKKHVGNLPIWKKILGIVIFPIMLSFWITDRALHLMLPHANHPSLKNYMIDNESIKLTFFRILFFAIPVGVILLVINYFS